MNKNNLVVGNYYYCDDEEIGSSHVEGKGKRPYYILCGIDNNNYFAIVCTNTEHKGNKKTFQDRKYIKNDIGSLLRKDAQIGFHVFKKNDIKEGKYRKRIGNLDKEKINELLKFYSYDIKSIKERNKKTN